LSDTDLNTKVDEAYTQVVNDLLPDCILSRQVKKLTVAKKTGGSGTTLTLDDASSFSISSWGAIKEGSRIEVFRILNIVGNTLTLESPGLIFSFTTSASVSPLSFFITATRVIKSCLFRRISSSVHTLSSLTPISDKEFFKQCLAPASFGTPKYFGLISSSNLFIFPPSQYDGYIEYYCDTGGSFSLLDDNSEPVFDTQFHYLIVLWCVAQCYLRQRDFDGFTATMNTYNTLLISYRNEINKKYSDATLFDLERKIEC